LSSRRWMKESLALAMVIGVNLAGAQDIQRIFHYHETGDMRALELYLKQKRPLGRHIQYVVTEIVAKTSSSPYYGRSMTSVRLLHEAGMDVNWWQGEIIVQAAGSDIAGKMVQRLLDYGANPNLARDDGLTALVAALHGNRPANAEILLKGKADPNQRTGKTGWIPLSIAAQKGDVANVKLLLKYGAKIDAQRGVSKMTALHEAAANDRADVIRILRKAGANRSIRDAKGFTALQLARRLNKQNAVRALHGG
jgi:hypothetical protein